jgi:hypothetical protein
MTTRKLWRIAPIDDKIRSDMDNIATIWREISTWPSQQRRMLATRLLQSLEQEENGSTVSKERQDALRQLIGIWKTDQPLNDEQVKRVEERERMKKHG